MEDWNTTPREALFDCIYESVVEFLGDDGWVPDLWGAQGDTDASLYIKDPSGQCWEILAKPHPHATQ